MKTIHENAYGLSRLERERLIRMAKSGYYYERYLSNKFNITDEAVQDLCKRMGNYVCKRLDEAGKHYDGYNLKKTRNDKI